jgi:hypothetical protein
MAAEAVNSGLTALNNLQGIIPKYVFEFVCSGKEPIHKRNLNAPQRIQVALLFLDVSGFSALADKLGKLHKGAEGEEKLTSKCDIPSPTNLINTSQLC